MSKKKDQDRYICTAEHADKRCCCAGCKDYVVKECGRCDSCKGPTPQSCLSYTDKGGDCPGKWAPKACSTC
jgi:hypothetical protein